MTSVFNIVPRLPPYLPSYGNHLQQTHSTAPHNRIPPKPKPFTQSSLRFQLPSPRIPPLLPLEQSFLFPPP